MPVDDRQTEKLVAAHRVMGTIALAMPVGLAAMAAIAFVIGGRVKVAVDPATGDALVAVAVVVSLAALVGWHLLRHRSRPDVLAGTASSVDEFTQRCLIRFMLSLGILEAPAVLWLIVGLLRGNVLIALPYLIVCLGLYTISFPRRHVFLNLAGRALTDAPDTAHPDDP